MDKEKKTTEPKTQPKISKFSKEQILTSEKYAHRRDAISACLEDKAYTIDEVDKTLDKFMKGAVN